MSVQFLQKNFEQRMDDFRKEVAEMPDKELWEMGRTLRFLTRKNQPDYLTDESIRAWHAQLEIAREEWYRRHPKQEV
jgi:hypothetical protein